MSGRPFIVYGIEQSYFTRKMTGYLDYKEIPWRLTRDGVRNEEARAVGWTGGMPPMATPEGDVMWDTTAMILYLEHRFPEPAVLPLDPVHRFLCFAIEDFSDEWLYRPAVGTRWLYEENTRQGSWELGRSLSATAGLSGEQTRENVKGIMQGSIHKVGATAENIEAWVEEVLKPWQRALAAHLAAHPYLFGERPSLADFAVFGGNVAHFHNDPLCRRWCDEIAPAAVAHTHRVLEPHQQGFGDWLAPGAVPDTLIALLAETGCHYLPWVAKAAVEGRAEVGFASGAPCTIDSTDFLDQARGVLLARYVELRSEALDAVLERAGILDAFAEHVGEAGTIPGCTEPPRPALNQPFPATPDPPPSP